MVIVERALIEYKKDGSYDYTIESTYAEFSTEEKAIEWIYKNISKNEEYYLYETQEDIEDSNSYKVIIANNARTTSNR